MWVCTDPVPGSQLQCWDPLCFRFLWLHQCQAPSLTLLRNFLTSLHAPYSPPSPPAVSLGLKESAGTFSQTNFRCSSHPSWSATDLWFKNWGKIPSYPILLLWRFPFSLCQILDDIKFHWLHTSLLFMTNALLLISCRTTSSAGGDFLSRILSILFGYRLLRGFFFPHGLLNILEICGSHNPVWGY